MPRSPNVDDPIWFNNNNDPPDPNPAPGVVTAVYPGNVIDCTITLADESTRPETSVNAPNPAFGYYRFWEPRDELE